MLNNFDKISIKSWGFDVITNLWKIFFWVSILCKKLFGVANILCYGAPPYVLHIIMFPKYPRNTLNSLIDVIITVRDKLLTYKDASEYFFEI